MSYMDPTGTEETPMTPRGEVSEVSSDDNFESSLNRTSGSKRSSRLLVFLLVTVLLMIGGYFFVSKSKNSDVDKIQGKVALSVQELKDVVVAKHLTVYWAGPQDGAKYALIAASPTIAYVRYLPGGVGLTDTKTLFRVIGTYAFQNAYKVAAATGNILGNIGFINSDGNSVFYSTSRTTNVYVGIKGKNIQVEVFDPGVDQAVGLVTVKGQIRPVA